MQIGHAFNPRPHYNSSYLNGKQPEPLRYTNATIIGELRKENDTVSKLSGSAMGRAGAAIMGGQSQTLSVRSPTGGMLPNSFKTPLEEIEEEIIALQ